jgi:hypothetical protein
MTSLKRVAEEAPSSKEARIDEELHFEANEDEEYVYVLDSEKNTLMSTAYKEKRYVAIDIAEIASEMVKFTDDNANYEVPYGTLYLTVDKIGEDKYEFQWLAEDVNNELFEYLFDEVSKNNNPRIQDLKANGTRVGDIGVDRDVEAYEKLFLIQSKYHEMTDTKLPNNWESYGRFIDEQLMQI